MSSFLEPWIVSKKLLNENIEYLLRFYCIKKFRGKSWRELITEIPVNYLSYSSKSNKVEFKSLEKFYIPEKFDACEYVELPLDAEERSKLAMATTFRPVFDDSVSKEVDLMKDMFYFKLELHGAKFKTKGENIKATVGYWMSHR